MSAEDVRKECPDNLKNSDGAYIKLRDQIVWLHAKWNEYRELYGVAEDRVVLLNRVAPAFSRIVQDALWSDILLNITRLTDHRRTGKKDNLTLQTIPDLVDDRIKTEIQDLVDKAEKASRFCRDWRNRHLAHCDRQLALNEGAEPLQTASGQEVDAALQAIADVPRAVERHCCKSDFQIHRLALEGGAVKLLYVLEAGSAAISERMENFNLNEPAG